MKRLAGRKIRLFPVSGGAIVETDAARRASPNGTSERSSTRPPKYRPRVSHDLTRVADRLQIAGDDFVERCSLRAGNLDDAVSRRPQCHIGDDGSNVVRAMGWNRPGENPDHASIRT